MAVLSDEALVGRLLDHRYRIGERIARGGMATVFKGQDERLDREIAIKVMHHGLGDDEEFTDRFQREARSAAKLNHRAVVSVFDQGTDDEVTYLVMEYVAGRTLREVMRQETPMDPIRVFGLLIEILTALSAAHAAHLIHRDIKPENVLITPEGDVKVADFGLARAVTAATTATGGTLIGTVSYLAPEIVVNAGADPRSDVYACGAMTFEMLTGSKPHTGDTPIQVAYRHVHEDVPPPSSLRSSLPDYVDAFVARATARDRDRRAGDARVLLQFARRVMHALQAGEHSDPALAADLLPVAPAALAADPAEPDLDASLAETAVAAPLDPPLNAATEWTPDHEPTMHWNSSQWSAPPGAATSVDSGGADDEQGRSHAYSSPRGRMQLILALVAALLVGLGAYWLTVGRYDSAPQLVGRSEAEAQSAASEAGFSFKVAKRAFSEEAPAGTVVATDPGPGGRILPGGTIEGTISKGKERYEVPDMEGMTLDQAQAALSKVKLKLGETTLDFSTTVPKNRVIENTNRGPGALVKKGTEIDVLVSKGREPLDVVDYTGKPGAESIEALRQTGFEVDVQREFSDDVDRGTVISQSPADGTKLRGDTIEVVVSRGPEEVRLPDVVGRPVDEARRVLEDAGFEVRVLTPLPGDTVRIQSPSADSKRKVGTTVTLVTSG